MAFSFCTITPTIIIVIELFDEWSDELHIDDNYIKIKQEKKIWKTMYRRQMEEK